MSLRTPSCCLILFLIFLNKVQNTQAQCMRPLLEGNLDLADNYPMDSYPDGSNATVKCRSGYIPVNSGVSRLISCNGTQWTVPELQCKKRSCGSPGEIAHGSYDIPDGIEFGATITAKCDLGFILQGGDAVRNCRESGWDGRAPICEAVKCLKPSSIKDGRFAPEQDFYNYGQTVTYSCYDNTFTLLGEKDLRCSANATFQPDPPRCVVISCDTPNIKNADRVAGKAPPYGYRNFVQYACKEGYKMNGTDRLVCEENGWNPPPPQCNGITCEAPHVENAHIIGGKLSYEYKERITFECFEGYKLNGSATLSCEESGWNTPPPQCYNVTCTAPQVANAHVVEDKPYHGYKESIKYTCFEGYALSGSATLTCGESGWSASPPLCNIITCTDPNVENANKISQKEPPFVYNDTVKYQCKEGHNLVGSDSVTCKETGWQPDQPQCIKNKLPGPSVTPPSGGSSTTVIAVSVVVAVLVLGYEAVI